MNIYETFFLFLYEDINRMVVTALGHNCKTAKDEITKKQVVFVKLILSLLKELATIIHDGAQISFSRNLTKKLVIRCWSRWGRAWMRKLQESNHDHIFFLFHFDTYTCSSNSRGMESPVVSLRRILAVELFCACQRRTGHTAAHTGHFGAHMGRTGPSGSQNCRSAGWIQCRRQVCCSQVLHLPVIGD